MAVSKDDENFPLRIEGKFADDFFPVVARVKEGLSQLTEITVELVCTNPDVDLEGVLGQPVTTVLRDKDDTERRFPGICVSIEYAGSSNRVSHFVAKMRPNWWFLRLRRNCRVFQNLNVPDIISEVLGDYQLNGSVTKKLTGEHPSREYTIQYRESDFDFVSRLMEEEGIYYHIDDDGKFILADDVGSHEKCPTEPVKFRPIDEAGRTAGPSIFGWSRGIGARSGEYVLQDYNFETPGAEMQSKHLQVTGFHELKDLQIFDYPGHFSQTSVGDDRAKIRMQAEVALRDAACGAANFADLRAGSTFTLHEPRREIDENSNWLVVETLHMMRQTVLSSAVGPQVGDVTPLTDLVDEGGDDYRLKFMAIPSDVQYRAPLTTPWPEISGVHTAVVIGPAGKEIYTDEYGRINLRFHWDRVGKSEDELSCWVRCMMPWTGKKWGMTLWPRVGQEVVVQFEEGNPDRPLVIGMLYNADMMPPYTMPENQTKSGIKTDSSPNGGGGFNELMMEDKTGEELVRFQAERDYEQIVKNDAKVTVGTVHKDPGDMSLTVHGNLTETLDTGDHKFTVSKGKQTVSVKKDKKETIEGKSTLEVSLDLSEKVKGNYSLDVPAGKIAMTAAQEIKLTCGASTITMTPADITIKAPMVKIQGDTMVEVKSLVTQVNGDATLILKGGVVMIN